MPSQSQEQAPPFWLWPNLLSLDAPLVAVLWQGFLAYRFSLPLRPAARFVLGLTVWAIYLLDRILDARKPPSLYEAARHRFYRRRWKAMLALLVLVVACDGCITMLRLRPAILRDGMSPLAGVVFYLATFHVGKHSITIPKEIAAAILFTAGTFLTAWTAIPVSSLAWPALAFFILCLANLVAIEAWEWRGLPAATPHALTRWLARAYLFWVPVVVVICAMAGRNEWYLSIALSAAACGLLVRFGRRFSLEARRALVDGVLLSPLLFLMLR